MTSIFKSETQAQFFKANGYVVFDLLDAGAVEEIWKFYNGEFKSKRDVHPFAKGLPYYISVFDTDNTHKQRVDETITSYVAEKVDMLLVNYEVFYSNFMIKFPGDGQIEAHQDFNFVDESRYTAFNLWCPLVDTSRQNGGLFVIPGSHRVFKTQRGPNIAKALTQYNEMLQRYAVFVPLKKGQAIIFDHRLIHYSPANGTDVVRVAIQSVLKPRHAEALHYFFDEQTKRVNAYMIDKRYIIENDLWSGDIRTRVLDHSEDLIPFPDEADVLESLVLLKARYAQEAAPEMRVRRVFRDEVLQRSFMRDGYVTFPVLDTDEIQSLRALFIDTIGKDVKNTDYGMYISLEEEDSKLKSVLVERICAVLLPSVGKYFLDCKPHLGSFLVKAPGVNSYTYPHQDWTFVDTPEYASITVWVALVDTDERNGALGFIKGSQHWFDKPIGSPSPYFKTYTQGHEDLLYEHLEFVSLRAGEAVAFDNRTIHGAPPNITDAHRMAVAVGMTPVEAPLYHFYMMPSSGGGEKRRVGKYKTDEQFFHRYSVRGLKQLFEQGQQPSGYPLESVSEELFNPFSRQEIMKLCAFMGLHANGKKLIVSGQPMNRRGHNVRAYVYRARDVAQRLLRKVFSVM